ncbi:MAG: DUF3553 domain-containing protein [Pseudomonadota bacterium]
MPSFLEPGTLVRHAEHSDWGLGQIQSVIGDRITVNFENVGKIVIIGQEADLEIVIPRGTGARS